MSNIVHAQGVVAPASRFTTFNSARSSSLLARVNWVFGLYVAAGVAYCLYHLGRVYQYTYHSYSLLDNKLKIVKCKALLYELQEGAGDVKPLLQECEALLASIPDSMSFEKWPLQLKLIQQYVKTDPNRSCELAQTLSSGADLFNAAQVIQKEAPEFDCSSLYAKAFLACKDEIKEVPRLLEFAKVFHSFQKDELKAEVLNKALDLQSKDTNALSRVRSLCKIAQCCQEMEMEKQSTESVQAAQDLCNDAMSPKDRIQAHLILAHTFFSMKAYDKMDKEIALVQELFDKTDVLDWIPGLLSYTKLIKMIASTDGVNSKLKSFSPKLYIESAFDFVSKNLNEMSPKSRIKAYLMIADAGQEVDDTELVQQAAMCAFNEIRKLPADMDEIESREWFLRQVVGCFKKVSNKTMEMMQLFESFYNQGSSERYVTTNKRSIGRTILSLYDEMKLSEQSTKFFNRYLTDLKNNNEDAANKIIEMTLLAKGYGERDFTLDQKKALLEAAEQLVPQVPSLHYARMMSLITEGYLKVDRLKALEFLKKYEDSQATQHLVNAATMAIAMGILYVNPSAGLFVSAGLAAYHFIRQ